MGRRKDATLSDGMTPTYRKRVMELSIEMVENARPWDIILRKELATRWGVSLSTVYKVYKQFLAIYAEDLAKNKEGIRAEFRLRVKRRQSAVEKDNPQILPSLMNIEAKVSGLYDPLVEKEEEVDDTPLTEAEAIEQLAAMPAHILQAALDKING